MSFKSFEFFFPDKTPNLTTIFKEDRNLWKETIAFIPDNIVALIETRVPAKKLVKIVAYKTPQSGIVNHQGIFKTISDFIHDLSPQDQNEVI